MCSNDARFAALRLCSILVLLASGGPGCSDSHGRRMVDAALDDASRPDAVGRPDAEIDPVDAFAADAGADERAGRVRCGGTDCSLDGNGCLATCLADGVRTPACVALRDERFPTECPSGEEIFPIAWLRCDGREDCAADEWCHLVRGSLGSYAFCEACAGECDPARLDALCRTTDECPPGAPVCAPNAELEGYSTCQAE